MSAKILSLLIRTKKEESPGSDGNPEPTAGQSLDKAQLRRAQVRKAQKQHRQRKANYVKQLEIDVARIRELISTTRREAQLLKRENDAMKSQIRQPPVIPSTISVPAAVDIAPPLLLNPDEMNLNYDFDLDDITMTLDFDDVLNAPTFRVSSSPSSSHYEGSNKSLSSPDATTTPACLPDTTPDQTQEAINFILSLEHICRNHFSSSRNHNPSIRASGHTLMATSLALRTAPDEIYSAASRATPLLRRATPSDLPPSQSPVEWQAAGLTLHNLYGLACSINPADLEITPVQAWFELAARFPLDLLLRRDVLDELKRELAPVVKCPHYGAQMERSAYESVVARVLGSKMLEAGQGQELVGIEGVGVTATG